MAKTDVLFRVYKCTGGIRGVLLMADGRTAYISHPVEPSPGAVAVLEERATKRASADRLRIDWMEWMSHKTQRAAGGSDGPR